MKIYSWNVFSLNSDFERVFDFIAGADWDVFCLQEVPEEFLERLKMLPAHVTYAVDEILFLKKGKTQTNYAVVLSRSPIISSGAVPFPSFRLAPRTRHAVKLIYGVSDVEKHGAVYADIAAEGSRVRVFSLHLALAGGPSRRKIELEVVRELAEEAESSILAGDFNIVEHPLTKSFNWFVGSPMSESHPWHDERSAVENFFASLGFKNPLRGRVTHAWSRSQLDHILVPKGATVLKAEVIKKTYGSDHHPIFVEVALSSPVPALPSSFP